MSDLTIQRVHRAYDALGSGDIDRALEYWDPAVRFLTPGNHTYAGWHEGIEAFMAFMAKVDEISAGTFRMEPYTVLVNVADGYSVDVNKTYATRSHAAPGGVSPYLELEIEGLHVLKWENGRVVEGRGAIFGDGMTRFNQWWSPLNPDGTRVVV